MLSLPDGEFKERQTRQSQVNRVIPSVRSGHKRDRTASEDTWAGNSASQNANIGHSEKMWRQAEAFDKNRPANVEQFQKWAPAKLQFSQLITSAVQGLYQQRVSEIIQAEVSDHQCLLFVDTTEASAILPLKETRSVVVFDTGRNFVLEVPTFQCTRCRRPDGSPFLITVPPCSVNCGAITPTEKCETWITDEALHLFGDLHARNGLSVGGKLISLLFLLLGWKKYNLTCFVLQEVFKSTIFSDVAK
jgi:hypothetical protein